MRRSGPGMMSQAKPSVKQDASARCTDIGDGKPIMDRALLVRCAEPEHGGVGARGLTMADDEMRPLSVELRADQFDNLRRFQAERGVPSHDVALRLLLDIAFEAVTARGQRYWDRPIVDEPGPVEPDERARALAERLRGEGHEAAADRLHAAVASDGVGHALLAALREACQTVLTTIEAIDPKTQLMAEELRLEIDKRLTP